MYVTKSALRSCLSTYLLSHALQLFQLYNGYTLMSLYLATDIDCSTWQVHTWSSGMLWNITLLIPLLHRCQCLVCSSLSLLAWTVQHSLQWCTEKRKANLLRESKNILLVVFVVCSSNYNLVCKVFDDLECISCCWSTTLRFTFCLCVQTSSNLCNTRITLICPSEKCKH